VELICHSEANLPEIASRLIDYFEDSEVRLVTISGDLGAGKTTLVSEICSQLGSIDAASSPTFAIINEYRTGDDSTIYHIDLYRMKDLQEALNIGIEDYLYSGAWCFIEWPEVIAPVVHPPFAELSIETGSDSSRRIRILIHSSDPANG